MKLRIEPPEAKKESYSGCVHRQAAGSKGRVLDFLLRPQEMTKWCWAAIAVSLGHYYGTLRWPQHRMAGAVLGFDCSRFREDGDVRARCDVAAMLDEAMRLAGCYSHWSPGRPTFERIRAEIDAGRPVCVQIDWYRGGSHYVVVSGYHAETQEVYIQDPLHGPSIQAFKAFPSSYRSAGGTWNGTFWTNPPERGSQRIRRADHEPVRRCHRNERVDARPGDKRALCKRSGP